MLVAQSASLVALVVIAHEVEGAAIHKELMISRAGFYKRERAPENIRHNVVIVMALPRMGELEEEVLRRSTPGDSMYQRWLTFEEVGSYLINVAATDAVQSWLKENGASIDWISPHHDFMEASAEISAWNDILDTKFHRYEDYDMNGRFLMNHTRSESYSIPDSMRGYIRSILHTSQPYPRLQNDPVTVANTGVFKGLTERVLASNSGIDVTVDFINTYYKISSNVGNSGLGQSIFSPTRLSFSQADLLAFQIKFDVPIQNAIVDGGVAATQMQCKGAVDCSTVNLGIEYIMGVAQNIPSLVSYVAPTSQSPDPFVAFVMNLAARDPQTTLTPLSVVSLSWGSVEASLSASTIDAFNTQAMKLAAMGVSLFVSSGDDGAVNSGCRISTGDPVSYSNNACAASSSSATLSWSASVSQPWSGNGYFPSFPASSPWVTAVGATMGPNTGGPEVACQSSKGAYITTGGGFSMYNPTPSWQSKNVSAYFRSLPSQPAPGFNPNGRGYPDVSLIGVKYFTIIGNDFFSSYGTSATAPVFAAMVNLVNSARKAIDLGTVGFINPTLYAAKSTLFKDITEGNNTCCSQDVTSGAPLYCCASGFVAATGWDPVTGLGSITYPDLLSILLAGATFSPTKTPSSKPSRQPTPGPSVNPTCPTVAPTSTPSRTPTTRPTSARPTNAPGSPSSSSGSSNGDSLQFYIVYALAALIFLTLLYCTVKIFLFPRDRRESALDAAGSGERRYDDLNEDYHHPPDGPGGLGRGINIEALPQAEVTAVAMATAHSSAEFDDVFGATSRSAGVTSLGSGVDVGGVRARQVNIAAAAPVRAAPVVL